MNHSEQLKLEEYRSLLEEHRKNQAYIFERELLGTGRKWAAPLDMCNKRIKERDSKNQVPVSQDLVDKINKKSMSIKLNFTLIIDNSKSSDTEIIESFKTILK